LPAGGRYFTAALDSYLGLETRAFENALEFQSVLRLAALESRHTLVRRYEVDVGVEAVETPHQGSGVFQCVVLALEQRVLYGDPVARDTLVFVKRREKFPQGVRRITGHQLIPQFVVRCVK
jgi:hypothetical protein